MPNGAEKYSFRSLCPYPFVAAQPRRVGFVSTVVCWRAYIPKSNTIISVGFLFRFEHDSTMFSTLCDLIFENSIFIRWNRMAEQNCMHITYFVIYLVCERLVYCEFVSCFEERKKWERKEKLWSNRFFCKESRLLLSFFESRKKTFL